MLDIVVKNSSENNFVTIALMGGLGNRLFQIASAYGIAMNNNFNLLITDDIHKNAHSDVDYFCSIFRNVPVNRSIHVNNVIAEAPTDALLYTDICNLKSTVKLIGYFQNEKYFEKYKTDIHQLFKIELTRKSEILNKYPDIINCYFIHFRRGDYVASKLHDVDLTYYYDRAIKYIKHNDDDCKFLVFSDDINYCKSLTYLKNINIEFIINETELDTLYMMSLCTKGGIGANSSFSWWGGYLNENIHKIIIYPSKWFNNNWNVDIGWRGCVIANTNKTQVSKILHTGGSLNDNLQISMLPELYSILGYNVYISSAIDYVDKTIKHLVWTCNPFVKGFVHCYDTDSVESSNTMMTFNKYPKIHYKPKKLELFTGAVLFDMTNLELFRISDIICRIKYICSIYPDNKKYIVNFGHHNLSSINLFVNTPYEISDMFNFCDAISSCSVFVSLHTGNMLALSIAHEYNTPQLYCICDTYQANHYFADACYV